MYIFCKDINPSCYMQENMHNSLKMFYLYYWVIYISLFHQIQRIIFTDWSDALLNTMYSLLEDRLGNEFEGSKYI
jgi:hypothetical protein